MIYARAMDWTELTMKAVELLAPVLLALLSWLSVKAIQWIGARIQNEYLKGALERLNAAVADAVKELEQTTVRALKEAAKDGKITREEAQKIKLDAIASVKDYLGQKGVAAIARVVGREAFEKMVQSKIEAYLHDVKLFDSLTPPSSEQTVD